MFRTVDLFAGCGGLSLGFQNAGYDIVAAFDCWNAAADCYEENFRHPVYRTDLSDTAVAIDLVKTYNPDIIIGGPPCQDFSYAGRRIEADRASLTSSFAEIVCAVRPGAFIMENVDRAAKSNTFSGAREKFIESGYGLTEVILDASKCGVPQKRKRFFCIGILNGRDDALKEILEKHMSNEPTTLRQYFGDKLGFEFYYRHPRNYNRRAVFSIDEPAPTMRGVNRPVPKGYPGHPNDACPLSPSIRALTTSERALIQTFPESFVWKGTRTDIEQMIGNAVPVKLAEFVANAYLEYCTSAAHEICHETVYWQFEGFEDWLISEKNYTQRAARDVVSRCRRSENILHSRERISAYYYFLLQQQKEFMDLSTSVRSQMKRAIHLQIEYSDYLESDNHQMRMIVTSD